MVHLYCSVQLSMLSMKKRCRNKIIISSTFYGSSHTSDLKIGTSVATLPHAWHHRVSAGTGHPNASIL